MIEAFLPRSEICLCPSSAVCVLATHYDKQPTNTLTNVIWVTAIYQSYTPDQHAAAESLWSWHHHQQWIDDGITCRKRRAEQLHQLRNVRQNFDLGRSADIGHCIHCESPWLLQCHFVRSHDVSQAMTPDECRCSHGDWVWQLQAHHISALRHPTLTAGASANTV